MSERHTYQVQLRNPEYTRKFSRNGAEFPTVEWAIASAKQATAMGIDARVVEIRRQVVWQSKRPSEQSTPEPSATLEGDRE